MQPEQMPWLPNGAISNAIYQMPLTFAEQVTNASDDSNFVAAFQGENLKGLRGFSAHDGPPRLFTHPWDEVGHTEDIAELWWGRAGRDHIIIGQETLARRAPQLRGPATNPFARDSEHYLQISQTHATFEHGNGGSGQIPPGSISHANLDLTVSPQLHGTLTFTVHADGGARSVTMPVMANLKRADDPRTVAPEKKYRIRAAAIVDGKDCRCPERPNVNLPYAKELCEFPDSPQENYEIYGAFFGDHCEYVGIQFRLIIDVPNRHRRGAYVDGLIILKSTS